MIYVADAHPLLWFIVNDKRLSVAAIQVFEDPRSQIVLPATAYAEICWVVQQGKYPELSVPNIQAAVSSDLRISVVALDQEIIDLSQSLTGIREMHDRQIVATALYCARTQPVTLLTRDEDITQSGLIPILW